MYWSITVSSSARTYRKIGRKDDERSTLRLQRDDTEALSGDTSKNYVFRRSGTNENAVAETVGVVMNQKKR
jgi:hypothetical protein